MTVANELLPARTLTGRSAFDRHPSKPVVRLEFALVHGRFFLAGTGSDGAGCPTEVKLRAERKHHVNAIQFGLETNAFRASRQE